MTRKTSHRALQRAKKRGNGLDEPPSDDSPNKELSTVEDHDPSPVPAPASRTHRGRRSIQRNAARRAQLVEELYRTTNASRSSLTIPHLQTLIREQFLLFSIRILGSLTAFQPTALQFVARYRSYILSPRTRTERPR